MSSEAQESESSNKITCTDVTCPVCGLSCDDIEVELDNTSVVTRNACIMGDAKFKELRSPHRITKPLINGQAAPWDQAIDKAADMLVNAKRPFFFIGSETATEAMAVGIEIAEMLGGLVDGNATICHGPTVMAVQDVGQAGCTLGETRNRADLDIYWGCNPEDSHPRHLSRHSIFVRGFFTEQGRLGRQIIVVDPRRSTTAEHADLHLQLKPGTDFEVLNAIMTILNGFEPNETFEEVTGISRADVYKAAEMVKDARFGVIWVGLGIASTRGKHYNASMAMRLTQLGNRTGKFVILANRGHCNVAGFNQVLTWSCGFPFAVDFSTGEPRYQPGEYSCVDALRRGEVDAMLVMCADLGAHLPKKAVERMCQIPVVSIETAEGPQAFVSDVVLPGVLDAMECEATFYRMDNVPCHARSFCSPPFDFTTSNKDTLEQLREAIKRKLAAREGATTLEREAPRVESTTTASALSEVEFMKSLDKLLSSRQS
ncbi:MAG: formylmethanofuran dehydrogenase subunit B [Halobacteriota archaeon]